MLNRIVTDYLNYYQERFVEVPGISAQSVKERLEIMYKCKVIFAFLPSDDESMESIWKLTPEGRNYEYRSGMGMTIADRRFVSYSSVSELNRLLFMLVGKNDPLCRFYYGSGGRSVFVGFPENEVYRVESIYDCADSQFVYDSVNFLITRDGHVGTHINTDAALALKQEIEESIRRRRNANDMLAGL